MRKPIVAGNWKMNKTAGESRELVIEMITDLKNIGSVTRVLCPPYLSIGAVAELVKGSEIGLGAQNLYWESSGAYTGEISPAMVAEICEYVIIGHSERRAYFGETDESVHKKLLAALAHGLKPIVCVGETLEENQGGKTAEVVGNQVRLALEGLTPAQASNLVLAYEPVWAIGTGLPATPEGANQVIKDHIRGPVQDMFGDAASQAVRVQYGGSVKPGNAREFFSQPDIDGALVGGASLKAADFIGIVQGAAQTI